MTQPETPKIAVITGRHPYEVVAFHRLFRSLTDFDCYIQNIEDWSISSEEERDGYESLVFYSMHREPPNPEVKADRKMTAAIERSLEHGQGFLLLHHAVLAFPGWDLWNSLVGIDDRDFGWHPDQNFDVKVTEAVHPLADGLGDFNITDETYTMNEPGEGSEMIFSTDHSPSMRCLGWTRKAENSRVFCLALGHGPDAYGNTGFQTVLSRGIAWTAGRLK